MSIKFEIYKRLPVWVKIRYSLFCHRKEMRFRGERFFANKKIYVIGETTNGNLGDLAISVAHIDFLADVLGRDVEIVQISYDEFWEKFKWLKRTISRDDLLTFVGGGNMGDCYVEAEEIRQVCMHVFRRNMAVVFPQTVHFSNYSKDNIVLQQSKSIYNAHKNLFIFAREERSYELMRELFPKCRVALVPDVALGYRRLPEKRKRDEQVLLCLRDDVEGTLSCSDKKWIEQICRGYTDNVSYTDTFITGVYANSTNERIRLVEGKLREFAGARMVVTDRLHGMVFAYLTNTPCVVVSNYNQKVSGVYQWISDNPNVFYADSLEKLESAIPAMIYSGNSEIQREEKCFAEKYRALADAVLAWAERD